MIERESPTEATARERTYLEHVYRCRVTNLQSTTTCCRCGEEYTANQAACPSCGCTRRGCS